MFQSRLIWSVNITHNFNTWEKVKLKCVERARRKNHRRKISRRQKNINWQAENELNARAAKRLNFIFHKGEFSLMNIIKIARVRAAEHESYGEECSHDCQKIRYKRRTSFYHTLWSCFEFNFDSSCFNDEGSNAKRKRFAFNENIFDALRKVSGYKEDGGMLSLDGEFSTGNWISRMNLKRREGIVLVLCYTLTC